MYFAAKSPQERNEWMEAFRMGMNFFNSPSSLLIVFLKIDLSYMYLI